MTTSETTTSARPIAPAATLLLLRERASGVEVLMMRRKDTLRFMAGMWVFPGGRVDPPDCAPGVAALLAEGAGMRGPVLRAPDGTPLSPGLALGLRIAACRETYEEAGVLLVCHPDGRAPAPASLRALQAAREDPTQASGAYTDLVAEAGLLIDVDRLVYWSHWITPSHESRRFDTHFFAVAMPEDQVAILDQRESTELAWLAPREVCAAAANGRMLLAPPTELTLEDLDEAHTLHGGVSAMLAAERGRATPPVMPRVVMDGATTRVLMPWDPAYPAAAGEGYVSAPGYPPHLARRRSSLIFRRA